MEQLAKVITVAADKPEADVYLYAIINANAEKMEELMRRKEGVILTEKLDAHFRERYAVFIAEGKAEGKAESVLTVLRSRFPRVPKEVEKAIRKIRDPIALDSWTAQAATCHTIDEFAQALR